MWLFFLPHFHVLPWPVWGPDVAADCWEVCLSGRSMDVWGPVWPSVSDVDPHGASLIQGSNEWRHQLYIKKLVLRQSHLKRTVEVCYFGSLWHRVPVSSRQAEVSVAYPVQDLIGCVLGSIGERSKTGKSRCLCLNKGTNGGRNRDIIIMFLPSQHGVE